jgi:hypothetical protein
MDPIQPLLKPIDSQVLKTEYWGFRIRALLGFSAFQNDAARAVIMGHLVGRILFFSLI